MRIRVTELNKSERFQIMNTVYNFLHYRNVGGEVVVYATRDHSPVVKSIRLPLFATVQLVS